MRQRFNPHKRVNDYQRYSMLTILPLSLCLAPSAIHLRSELQATIIFAGITIPLSAEKDILKVFVYLMMRNVMVKTCLNQKIIKNSNLIQAMKNSVCPKAKVIRRPNFSESRICPNIYRMFRSVDRTHDMIIVKWHQVTLIHFFGKPNLSEYLPNIPKCGLNTRHDNREVALTHLTQAQTLRSDKCATGSIHTNGSMTINVIPCKLFCRSDLCLAPSAIHLRPELQATIIFAGITIHWSLRCIFWKCFCVSDDNKCYRENMS